MQGESDAEYSQESADSYLENLKNLMALFRAALRNENLPVVIGKINDSYMTPDGKPTQPFIEIVHLAQKKFTDSGQNLTTEVLRERSIISKIGTSFAGFA